MDEDIRQSLDEIRRELRATTGELRETKKELQVQLRELRSELQDRIERVETSLLTEFHKWASPMELRARSHAAAIRALDLEHEALAERVKTLEQPPIS